MSEMLLDGGVTEILARMTDAGQTSVAVTNPSSRAITALVDTLDPDGPHRVNLLARETVLKAVMGDFIVASAMADLEEAGVVSLRTDVESAENAIMVTDSLIVALIAAETDIVGIGTDDAAFVSMMAKQTEDRWARGDRFSHRTPARSSVRESLGEEIGEDVWEDFDAMLTALDTARGEGEGLDEVAISLLVAARNGVLLYDISKWGEDVGLASKATFSRTKTHLEDAGLIDTEKVPIEIGRPRLRLVLGDEQLKQASIDDLANDAIGRLELQ